MAKSMYHDRSRHLQDSFDTRRLADLLERRTVSNRSMTSTRTSSSRVTCSSFATSNDVGFPTVSYKGGDPGFVTVIDEQSLAFPSYDGNGMFLSTGNVLANAHVALLFIDFANPARLRVHGDASIDECDPMLDHYPEAQLVELGPSTT